MNEVRTIKQSESGRYKVIEYSWRPGEYMLKQECGSYWKEIGRYKRVNAAIKKMEALDRIWVRFLESLKPYMD